MKFYKSFAPIFLAGLVFIQSVPVYASSFPKASSSSSSSSSSKSGNYEKNLTVDDASKKAINHSESLKKSQESEDLSDEKYKDLKDDYRNANTTEGAFGAQTNILSFELSRSLNIKNMAAQKENVEYSIIQLFNSILNAESSLALYDEQIAFSLKNLEISKLKLELGLISQVTYDEQKLVHDKLVQSRALNESAINSAYVSLNELMGQDLNRKYDLILYLDNYKDLEEINLTSHTNSFIAKSLEIKQAEDKVEVTKYAMDHYMTSTNPLTGEIISTETAKIQTEQAYAQATRNKTYVEESVKKNVISSYNSIRDLEVKIKTQTLDIDNNYKQLDILKKQLELGQTTQIALDKLTLEIHTSENDLRVNKNSHTIMVMAFKNPNLLSSGSSSGGGDDKAK